MSQLTLFCVFFLSLQQERIFLTLSNYIFTAIFVAEMSIKVCLYSFLKLGLLLLNNNICNHVVDLLYAVVAL